MIGNRCEETMDNNETFYVQKQIIYLGTLLVQILIYGTSLKQLYLLSANSKSVFSIDNVFTL